MSELSEKIMAKCREHVMPVNEPVVAFLVPTELLDDFMEGALSYSELERLADCDLAGTTRWYYYQKNALTLLKALEGFEQRELVKDGEIM